MKRKLELLSLSVLLSFVCAIQMQATEFRVDNAYYEVVSGDTVAITDLTSAAGSGSFTVPTTVTFNSKTYVVAYIDIWFSSSKVKELIIPAGINVNGSSCDWESKALETITVDENNKDLYSKDGVMYNKVSKEILVIPRGIRGTLTFDEGPTAAYCKNLDNVEGIVLPVSVKYASVTNLPNLTSLSITALEYFKISDCPLLSTITKTQAGGDYDVEDNVVYEPTTIEIGGETLKGRSIVFICSGRTSYHMPADVFTLPAFYKYENLAEVTIAASNPLYEASGNVVYSKETKGAVLDAAGGATEVTLSSDLTGIAEHNCYGSESCWEVPMESDFSPYDGMPLLRSIKTLKAINMTGASENYRAENGILYEKYDEDKWAVCCVPRALAGDVVLPDFAAAVGEKAFFGNSITSVTIPAGCEFDFAPFAYCESLANVTFLGDAEVPSNSFYMTPWLRDHEAGVIYAGNTAIGMAGGLSEITVKEGTKTIGYEAFSPEYGTTSHMLIGGYNLEKVTLPAGLESIHGGAFNLCYKLKSINLPASLKEVDGQAFAFCSNLSDVTLDEGIKFVPDIYDDLSVTTIHVPASVEAWKANDLNNKLTAIEVDADNKVFSSKDGILYDKYGTAALVVPSGIQHLNIQEGCTAIGVSSSRNAKSVTRAVSSALDGFEVPDLSDNNNIESITLPSTLTNIYQYGMFSNCYDLKECRVKATTPPAIDEYTFPYDLSEITLYVPTGTKNAYQNATEWSRFTNIEEFDVSGIEGVESAESAAVTTVYNTNGQQISHGTRGLNILRMSNGTARKVLVK